MSDDKNFDERLADVVLGKDQYKTLQQKASAWDRVMSIANDGVGLKASEIKAIEEQMVK
jgi:hypothetical protein